MWSQKAKHCPVCGVVLELRKVEGRERPSCPECSFVQFLNPASAAAGVVLDETGRLLLIRRKIRPFEGSWAVPAGYQEVDEAPEDTVRREVFEETGVRIEVERLLELVWVPDDPRKPANVAFFLCRALDVELTPGHDAKEARWFDPDALPDDLGFDNRTILNRLLSSEDDS